MGELTTTVISVKFSSVGYHNWPDAPLHRAYLRALHRHVFGIEVKCFVTHDDRQIEFHDLLGAATLFWPPNDIFGAKSCEMLARDLGSKLRNENYPVVSVTVSEDGESAATVIWEQ
jgi:hypothetical protein